MIMAGHESALFQGLEKQKFLPSKVESLSSIAEYGYKEEGESALSIDFILGIRP